MHDHIIWQRLLMICLCKLQYMLLYQLLLALMFNAAFFMDGSHFNDQQVTHVCFGTPSDMLQCQLVFDTLARSQFLLKNSSLQHACAHHVHCSAHRQAEEQGAIRACSHRCHMRRTAHGRHDCCFLCLHSIHVMPYTMLCPQHIGMISTEAMPVQMEFDVASILRVALCFAARHSRFHSNIVGSSLQFAPSN